MIKFWTFLMSGTVPLLTLRKCGLDTMAPVHGAHQMDDINLELYLGLHPRPRLCPLELMINYGLFWWPGLRCEATLDTSFATSHPRPPVHHPLSCTDPKFVRTSKNYLKWPEIKQVTNSKLYYNKVNRLLSPVLQNIVGLTQAKAGYTN